MSEPDILSQISVTGPVKAHETPTATEKNDTETQVTVASDTEVKGQVSADGTEQSDLPNENSSATEKESKSKEERKADGSKIEKKMNNLYKGRAEAQARASRAETELAHINKLYQELQEQTKSIDLDTLSFDERVAYLSKRHVNEELLQSKAQAAQYDLHQAHQQDWDISAEDFQAKANAVAQNNPDYYDSIENARGYFSKLPDFVTEAVINSKNGAEMAYVLSKNTEVLRQLQNPNPVIAAQILLDVEASIKSSHVNQGQPVQQYNSVQATPRINQTPANTTRSHVSKHWEVPMEDFMARKQQLFGRRF
jgi:hypothetical protein